MPERPPVGESQSNGIIERTVGLVAGQARTPKAALEHRKGAKVPPDARILCWLVDIGSDGKDAATQAAWTQGQHIDPGIWREDFVHARQASKRRKARTAIPPRSVCWILNLSSEGVVVTEQGSAIKTRAANVKRVPVSERWDADRILGIRAVPWNAFDFQVGMERPAEMVPRSPGEVLMENNVARTYLRRADFDQWCLSEGCSGCRYLRIGQGRQHAHGEACRKSTDALMKGNASGSARLAAADERINRALAEAVGRHATKDPGMRGILKRASVVCHSESEPQKKIALDTEQTSPPRTSVTHGGSSSSGAHEQKSDCKTHPRHDTPRHHKH